MGSAGKGGDGSAQRGRSVIYDCLVVMCDSAGVMYWGDASLDKIETAYLNGTGRRILLSETNTHYYAFVLHDGNLYFTDWRNEYAKYCDEYVCLCVCLSARISPEPRAQSVRTF